ncbi:hypothetical protein CANARDRAFT_27800 [[Candida] arabinofermentans NRRL YB-2248]|uniref:Uncharacterized protein n=1 Tax=[Candida] arabinofermentans NRRL YB-2248 TaxID=983967 RepID=A0A1E4T1R6_9ASCO|nr:hypothetical protein CANARDRAFT_27800 [[Candida] arabinofermentans NRRL YB-2248]
MIPTFNWTRLSDEFDIIYTEYTDGMKQTIEEFEKIDFTRLVWQDSAHKVDGDRATKRINAIEEWTINTEGYLEQLRQELASSLSVIQSTLSKLDDGKVYSHIEPENSEIPPNGPN